MKLSVQDKMKIVSCKNNSVSLEKHKAYLKERCQKSNNKFHDANHFNHKS